MPTKSSTKHPNRRFYIVSRCETTRFVSHGMGSQHSQGVPGLVHSYGMTRARGRERHIHLTSHQHFCAWRQPGVSLALPPRLLKLSLSATLMRYLLAGCSCRKNGSTLDNHLNCLPMSRIFRNFVMKLCIAATY